MLPSQSDLQEVKELQTIEANPKENASEYVPVVPVMSMQAMQLQPIAENVEDHRPSVKTITTLPKFNIRNSIRYTANQRFKVKKKRRKRRRKEEEEEEEDDDVDEDYDIWNRPRIENAEAHSKGRQQILTEYDQIHSNIDHFLDLMLENETECDKLVQLMCNKKLTSKDLSKQNKECDEYELFDILRLNDADDDGGLNPNDYDIDLREMEHLFHTFNNDILHSFMSSYHGEKLPFEPRQPYPMGQIETDITKERKLKSTLNPDYMAQHRRKNKQQLRDKHVQKKQRARKKRRRRKQLEMKLAQKKLAALNEHLSAQLAPETLNVLFNPRVIDADNDDDEEEEEEEETKEEEEESQALASIQNNERRERLRQLSHDRSALRRQAQEMSERHSSAMHSAKLTTLTSLSAVTADWVANVRGRDKSARFDDDTCVSREVDDMYSDEQVASKQYPRMSRDYDGRVKRYARPIKMDQVEKVIKFVLFSAARQYCIGQYLDHEDVRECVARGLEAKRAQYDECKKLIIGGHKINSAEYTMRRSFELRLYVSQLLKRDVEVLVQNHVVLKQRAMLQLMSMGLDIPAAGAGVEKTHSSEEVREAFVSGVVEEDKLIFHDEDDAAVRQSAIVYDSSDDATLNTQWQRTRKWQQKELDDHVATEVKMEEDGKRTAQPWKKLHSKYCDEFVSKLCGFYPFESRPVMWKRLWHSNCNEHSGPHWPTNWMELYARDELEMESMEPEDTAIDDSHLKWPPCVDWAQTQQGIDALPNNLSDVVLPHYVWKLSKRQLSKYGTYLFANWKQASDGKVTTAVHPTYERFPVAAFPTDLVQRRWLSSMKWYVYRLRYWEEITADDDDIVDFLADAGDEIDDKEAVDWFGSNDRSNYRLLEDRILIQNDDAFGAATLFVWSHDFCNSAGPTCRPVKIRNYGVSSDLTSEDPIVQERDSKFNLNQPICGTAMMATDGPCRSGSRLRIGAVDPLDYEGVNGIVAMDAYVPPVFNLSVYDDADTLFYNWNRVNHDCTQADRASSRIMTFGNRDASQADYLVADENNILKSYDVESAQWHDYKNYPAFDALAPTAHPSVLSHAFFFNNFLSRTYHDEATRNIAKITYPRAFVSNFHRNSTNNKKEDEWTFSFGFTHPRPVAPDKYCVLFYKKDCIEVRITADTSKLKEAIDDADEEEEKDANIEQTLPLQYEWSEERLECMLFVNKKKVTLFSEVIRSNFECTDAFYAKNKRSNKYKKCVFVENEFMSHVVIICRLKNGRVKAYLDAKLVCDKKIGNGGKTSIMSGAEPMLLAHKPGNKEGRVHGLFHGYLFAIALHACAATPYELNTMYRQLKCHRDAHVVKTWFRNKLQAAPTIKYKQIL